MKGIFDERTRRKGFVFVDKVFIQTKGSGNFGKVQIRRDELDSEEGVTGKSSIQGIENSLTREVSFIFVDQGTVATHRQRVKTR